MKELTTYEMEQVNRGGDSETVMTGLGYAVVGALGAAAALALAISPVGALGFAVYGSAAMLGVGAVISLSIQDESVGRKQ